MSAKRYRSAGEPSPAGPLGPILGETARIECLFPETLLPQVKMALRERVCIRGRVHCRWGGMPDLVGAHSLRVLRPLEQLPSIEAMIGCARTTS